MLQVDLPVSASRGHLANPNTTVPSTPTPWNKVAAIFLLRVISLVPTEWRKCWTISKNATSDQPHHLRLKVRTRHDFKAIIWRGQAMQPRHFLAIASQSDPLWGMRSRSETSPPQWNAHVHGRKHPLLFLSFQGSVQTLTVIHLGSVQLDHMV